MRKPIIAGNWKMNNTMLEAKELISALIPLVKDAECDVVVCVPYTALATVKELVSDTNIKVGAQNMHFAQKGAYTGEISADMLNEIGVEYVILGHSERRQYFNETDATVNKKAIAAIAAKLVPIICVGEVKEERENNITNEVVSKQTKLAYLNISAQDALHTVVAYEPVWAIGTGLVASNEQANETIGAIRSTLKEVYGDETAQKIRIQYGGSMNPANVNGLMSEKEIDGGLIGGASLNAEDFAKVVNFGQ